MEKGSGRLLETLQRIHTELIALAAALRFDKDHPWHRNLVSLYLSIVELSGCIPVLMNSNHGIGIPSILRSLLDTYIEYVNLSADKNYGNFMELSYSSQWLKLLVEAQTGTNQYLKDFATVPELRSRIKELQQTIQELKGKGYRELSIKERFERAGHLDQYKSIYNYLCNNDHPNIRALIDRHIELDESDFSIVMYKDNSEDKYFEHITHACSILLDSSFRIHNILSTGKEDAVKEMVDRFVDNMKERLIG
jgi:hypothetical protein